MPAGIEDLRIHELRRTVGGWLAQAGNDPHLIGRVLNHTNVSTTKVYARFGQDSVRTALERHGEPMPATAGLKPSAETVDIKIKAAGFAVELLCRGGGKRRQRMLETKQR